MTRASLTPIQIDENGVPWIDNTKVKVIEVVLDKLAYGWSPEEISLQHYHSLTLAQIHAAFSYYYDHQAEMDAEIARQRKFAEEQKAAASATPGRQKLRASGLRP